MYLDLPLRPRRNAPGTVLSGRRRGPITTNFMSLTQGRYRRYADAQQQVIDLPYGNQQFSMTLGVPQGQSTLADVAGRLTSTQLGT